MKFDDFLGRDNYFLSELGITLIFPNVRGSTGYGKTFLASDNGYQREGSYQDINALFDWIASPSSLDANQVMVTGGSYGGFMTLAVATNYNDRICYSVDVVGPSNLVTFLEHTSGYRPDLRASSTETSATRKCVRSSRASPFNKAKNVSKPMFVIAGNSQDSSPEQYACLVAGSER